MSNLDLISEYLEGKMTDAERLSFEEKLGNDPGLQREYDFQSEISDALKEARSIQLKDMLNKVDVSGTSGNYAMGRWAAIASFVAVIGVTLYLYLKPDQHNNSGNVLLEQRNQEVANDTNNHSNSIISADEQVSKTIEAIESKDKDAIETPQISTDTDLTKTEAEGQQEAIEVIAEQEKVAVNSSRPDFVKPNVIERFDSGSNRSVDIPIPGADRKVKNSRILNIEIETDNTRRKYSFHYQFQNHKLYLLGEFDKGLYEILEFHSAKGRQLYLYYDENFYAIDETQTKITALETITDENIVMKLKMIKDNRR